tara:strand:- start:115 stop:2085 length:1971 start_codon:yes stop_codon:yes gene_type:complete
MRECLVVEDRDERSSVVPLKLNRCQEKLHELIENVRAYNIVRNANLHDDQKAISFATLPLGVNATAGPSIMTRIREVRAYGVDELLLDLADRRPDIYLSDGPVRVVVTKCRRGGVSSYLEGRAYLAANFTESLGAFVMAHRGPNAKRVFKYASDYFRYWNPRYEAYRKGSESERKDGYEFANNSRFTVATSGGDNAARGDQFDYYHFSETAFYDDYEEVKVALAARPAHAFIFEESTGNGPNGGFYHRAMNALPFKEVVKAHHKQDAEKLTAWNGYFLFFFGWLEDPKYREKLFGWEREHIEDTQSAEEKDLVRAGADMEQLQWRRTRIKEFAESDERAGLPPELFFTQEYPASPEECFVSSATKWFDQRKLKRMLGESASKRARSTVLLDSEHDPRRVSRAQSNLQVFVPPKPNHYYSVGADVAQGFKHGDWSVGVVLDYTHPGRTVEVCTLRVKCPAPAFGEMLTTLCEWYNSAFLVPEVNGPGLAACQRLVDNRYPRIYHRQTLDMVKANWSSGDSFRFGFSTNNATKGRILSDTQDAIRKGELILRHVVNIKEHQAFEAIDGKYRAPDGLHDDCVIATALAFFGLSRAPRAQPKRAQRLLQEKQEGTPEERGKEKLYEALMRKVARDATKHGLSKDSTREGAKKFRGRRRSL